MEISSAANPLDDGIRAALRDLTPDTARRLGAAGMRTFVAIADEWQLPVATRCTLLGGIGASIHPYPTQSEAIRKVGDLYGRTRLTPFVKRLFGRWLAWQRS
jgi:hypothetical protein